MRSPRSIGRRLRAQNLSLVEVSWSSQSYPRMSFSAIESNQLALGLEHSFPLWWELMQASMEVVKAYMKEVETFIAVAEASAGIMEA